MMDADEQREVELMGSLNHDTSDASDLASGDADHRATEDSWQEQAVTDEQTRRQSREPR